ncbi:NAD-dependent protein deacylase [Guggenheimella bovis]
MDELKKLTEWVQESRRIVFFGGAGTSTAAGIPDFRSASGLYNQKNDFGYPPEYLLSHDFLEADPDGFSDYYKHHLIFPDAKPTVLHEVLYEWEKSGKLLGIITQNIDELHQKAGNRRVVELHGTLSDHYCTRCHRRYSLEEAMEHEKAMYCEACGGFVRPRVTLYGESLDQEAIEEAVYMLRNADLLIIGGTSLVVYPAAGLVRYYGGERLAVVNQQRVKVHGKDALFLQEDLEMVFSHLKVAK